MTEKEKMLIGELYNATDEELFKERIKAKELLKKYNETAPMELDERKNILKVLLGKTGENIIIEPTFQCDYGYNITIGENFYANYHLVILDVAKVEIGDNCFIGPQVGIYTASHPLDTIQRNNLLEFGKSIKIGNNCWIGGNSVINPGVALGDNVIVGSGAVVTKSFGDNVIIAGNPAKVIKKLNNN